MVNQIFYSQVLAISVYEEVPSQYFFQIFFLQTRITACDEKLPCFKDFPGGFSFLPIQNYYANYYLK